MTLGLPGRPFYSGEAFPAPYADAETRAAAMIVSDKWRTISTKDFLFAQGDRKRPSDTLPSRAAGELYTAIDARTNRSGNMAISRQIAKRNNFEKKISCKIKQLNFLPKYCANRGVS